MSLLPGEMTKHSLRAPAIIIRSTRYSLTARGRSISPSKRLPTGSSSLLNASGWMRLPSPAAGMIPHMALRPLPVCSGNQRQQLVGAAICGVIGHRPPVGRLADAGQLLGRTGQRLHHVVGGAGEEDLAPRL